MLKSYIKGGTGKGRARQGIELGFKIQVPTPEGLTDHLAELQFIGTEVSWFLRGADVRGKGRASGWPLLS